MIKRRNNQRLVLRGGLLCMTLLLALLPGCKEKPTPPPQTGVMPLPKKPIQQNVSAAKQTQAKPAGASGEVKPVAAPPAGGKQITAPPSGPAATPVPPTAAAAPVANKLPVQKQVSSSKLTPPPSAVSFDFTNKRDPFKPYVQAPVAQPAPGKPVRKLRDLLPIQSFDTEKFKVTGIITGIRENSALILDPNGKGYVVREGMLVGSNDGKIKRITNSTVEVEEVFRDDGGRMKKRLVKLTLTRKK
jgi:type IV pilus assembly protein PilP